MRVYRTKELTTDRQRIYLAARIDGATPIEAMKIAKYPHPESNYQKIENSKRMQYLLRRKMPKVFNVITPEWAINRLVTVVERTIPDSVDDIESGMKLPDYNVGIKAISEISKIKGFYAPTQSQNMNINVKTDNEQAKEIADNLNKLERYKQDF